MSNYNGFIPNDFINGEGVCVSLWTQGCPHQCPGCFNPETFDINEGIEIPNDLTGRIIKAISANNITRNFSILGGEPLASWNLDFVSDIVSKVRIAYPHIKIFLWTGYTMEEIQGFQITNPQTQNILDKIDVLIDGPFIQEEKNLTLKLRGSKNQNIYRKNENGNWEINND